MPARTHDIRVLTSSFIYIQYFSLFVCLLLNVKEHLLSPNKIVVSEGCANGW